MTASPLIGVDHIGLLVHDIEAALPYYTDVLGFTVVGDDVNASANARLVYLDAGNMIIQLVSSFGPGIIADALAERGEGLHHVCFQTESIDSAAAYLAPGAKVNVTIGGRNRRTSFLPDRPNGLIMELTELEEVEQ
jgi:catechol 2,3-dioxygenase-like lactoylglutathione lyase family enzyme